MRRLFNLILFLALAICQVPGSVVVGQCEMACCKTEVSAKQEIQEKQNCCCSYTSVQKHVSNDVAGSLTITGEFDSIARPPGPSFVNPSKLEVNRAPIPHAQGPPGLDSIPLPPSRAPPVS